MKPRMVIDARCVGKVPHGMHVFTSSLAEGLEQLGQAPYETVFLVSPENSEPIFLRSKTHRMSARFLSPRELLEVPRTLRKLDARLYHSPTFSSLLSVPCPWVQTIHDLNHLKFGSLVQKAYYQFLLKPFARQAAHLCTVSEFSKREIEDWLGEGYPVSVTYNAIRGGQYVDSPPLNPVFFCLTNSKPHKNIDFLLAAYGEYRDLCQRQKVKPWKLQISIPAEGRSQVGVDFFGSLTSGEVERLRSSAGAIVFPSLYEGFGLPPVEAAIQGILPLVSRIPPHEEGLGSLASDEVGWYDPTRPSDCAQVLLKATLGQYGRPSRASAARIRERWSSLGLAVQMDRIYREILGIS